MNSLILMLLIKVKGFYEKFLAISKNRMLKIDN